MKAKNVLLLSILIMLVASACRKEGGFDHRSKYITHSLRGKTFTVYRIIGVNHKVDLNYGYAGSHIIMSFASGNTSIDFIPGDTSYRFIYPHDPYRRICKLADFQHFFMGYSANQNLNITTSTFNPPEILLSQIVDTKQVFESIPTIALDGEYEVVKGYPDGKPGFILNKYEDYTNQGNGRGQIIMIIELISR